MDCISRHRHGILFEIQVSRPYKNFNLKFRLRCIVDDSHLVCQRLFYWKYYAKNRLMGRFLFRSKLSLVRAFWRVNFSCSL